MTFKSRFKPIIDSLKRHRALLLDERMTAAIIEVQNTRKVTVQTLRDLAATSDVQYKHLVGEVDTVYRQLSVQMYESEKVANQRELNRQKDDCLVLRSSIEEKLAAPNYKADHQEAVRQRFVGSGEGILQDKRFLEWAEGQDAVKHILYLHGKPGAGKL